MYVFFFAQEISIVNEEIKDLNKALNYFMSTNTMNSFDAINIFTTKSVIKYHVISLECQQCNGRNRMSITHGSGRVHFAR